LHNKSYQASKRRERMADENTIENASLNAVAETTGETPTVKKTRGPGRSRLAREAKIAAEAASAVEPPVKKTRAKRGSKSAAKAIETTESAAVKTRAPRGRAASKVAQAGAVSTDEFADLLALEQENLALRKQLSEKLRAENADLRKRLGKA
jgi:hypothetical protein